MNTRAYLTAFEHQPLGISDDPCAITAQEAEFLLRLNDRRTGFCERRYRSVRLAQYAGLVSMGNRLLEVLPKVNATADVADCRGIFLRLLRLAGVYAPFLDDNVGHSLRNESLLDVFIAAFLDSVLMVARRGLLSMYQEEAADLRFVRGKIAIQRQLTALHNRPDIVACEYVFLTIDNTWNRSLKLGLKAVRPWITSAETYRKWNELVVLFDDVCDIQSLPAAFVYSRQSERYRPAVTWVQWIVSSLSPSVRAGRHDAPSLLFDMNKLFEKAVAKKLQYVARLHKKIDVVYQDTSSHLARIVLSGKVAPLRPDLVVRQDGAPVLVADMKWKLVEANASGYVIPAEADMYQMLAYSSAFRCDEVVLVYPWNKALSDSLETTMHIPTKAGIVRLHIACIDVETDALEMRRGAKLFDFSVQPSIPATDCSV